MVYYARYISLLKDFYRDEQIIPEVLERIKNGIVDGSIGAVSVFQTADMRLDIDINNGWAAIMLSDEMNRVYYYYRNRKYDDLEDFAPVDFGGQSPAPKPIACDDLMIAANIFTQFTQSGTRFPTTWACWADEAGDFVEW